MLIADKHPKFCQFISSMVYHVSFLLKYIRTPAKTGTTAITGTPAKAGMPVTARRPAKADTLSIIGTRVSDPDPYWIRIQ